MKRAKLVIDRGPAQARALLAWRTGQQMPGQAGLAWLDRAHRLAPADQNVRFSLAARLLQLNEHAGAMALFAEMAGRFGTPESRVGLAACQMALGLSAADTVADALSSTEIGPALANLAERVVRRNGLAGWCGVTLAGRLWTDGAAGVLSVRLDGADAAFLVEEEGGSIRLPAGWWSARSLRVLRDGQQLLGSPVRPAVISRLEGFVEIRGRVLAGTAWHPAAPGHDPEMALLGADGTVLEEITAVQAEDEVDGSVPLTRRRVFRIARPPGLLRVVGKDGRDLLGSPLQPGQRRQAGRRHALAPRQANPALPVDVIIPVYRGMEVTLACIGSVLDSVSSPHRVLVVDDASPEPALIAALEALADAGRIVLLHTGESGAPNRGFPAAVNAGLRAAAGRHVVLLNSDTLVAPGWLAALIAACCSAADVGTATPLSNEASIFSFPRREGGNPAPDLRQTCVLAEAAARANPGVTVDVPTAHGFCMFIRADCLAQTGLFDETSFAQGYGEENDFSERARLLGWRHVAAAGVFVAHRGGVSFGGAGGQLLRRNLGILDRRYPAYRGRVEAFIAADPLAEARRNLDMQRWTDGRGAGAPVLLITHGVGGGTARVVEERCARLLATGFSPIVLGDRDGLCEVSRPGEGFPNLVFDLPAELPALVALLADPRPVAAELHHLLGHDHSILGVLHALSIPYDVWVHDYAWFCARVSFVTGDGRFCGEADTRTCEACIAQWDRRIEDDVSPAELRRRSARDLLGARQVIAPSEDVARRVARHVPGLPAAVVRAWESDPAPASARVLPHHGGLHVAVVGAIGQDKGYDVLLACALDAATRSLAVRFTVIGYTVDDDMLLATGCAFVTGAFRREEAASLIRAQNAHVGLMPSVWPETWCFALSDIWSAGLSAAVFDIGTPAARVRACGRGWVLPLGLPPARLNDALLSLRTQEQV